MPVLIHADFLLVTSLRDHPLRDSARAAMEAMHYEALITTEGMISQFLHQTANEGSGERANAVEVARALFLRPGTVHRTDFAQFTAALDAYRNEFRDSILTLEDVIAVLLLRETDSTDILSANPEFHRFGLRPLMV